MKRSIKTIKAVVLATAITLLAIPAMAGNGNCGNGGYMAMEQVAEYTQVTV